MPRSSIATKNGIQDREDRESRVQTKLSKRYKTVEVANLFKSYKDSEVELLLTKCDSEPDNHKGYLSRDF